MKSSTFLILATLINILLFIIPSQGLGAGWRVMPIRVDLDQRSRSSVVTIINEGESQQNFKIECLAWDQDENGQDDYSTTSEVVFFPKQLVLNPKEERVIRVGIKTPPLKKEKTYRLFIREVPPPREASGTTVGIAIQFGIPIFSKPVSEDIRGEISEVRLEDSNLEIAVHNGGNSHFRIRSIDINGTGASGLKVFSQQASGGYLLAETARGFTTPIPAEVCFKLQKIEVQVIADRIHFNRQIDVHPAMCATQ